MSGATKIQKKAENPPKNVKSNRVAGFVTQKNMSNISWEQLHSRFQIPYPPPRRLQAFMGFTQYVLFSWGRVFGYVLGGYNYFRGREGRPLNHALAKTETLPYWSKQDSNILSTGWALIEGPKVVIKRQIDIGPPMGLYSMTTDGFACRVEVSRHTCRDQNSMWKSRLKAKICWLGN